MCCYSLHPGSKHSYLINDPHQWDNWTIGDQVVPKVTPGVASKYLGAKIEPFQNVLNEDLAETLEVMCANINKFPIKPSQKVEVLQTYVLSKLTYPLSWSGNSKSGLEKLDTVIRRHVKAWLKRHVYLRRIPLHAQEGWRARDNMSDQSHWSWTGEKPAVSLRVK